jgi:hypothetical protein
MRGPDGSPIVASFGDHGEVVSPPDPQGPDAAYLKSLSVSVLNGSKVAWNIERLSGYGAYPQAGAGYDRVYIEDLADQIRCQNGSFSSEDIAASVSVYSDAVVEFDMPEALYPDGTGAINYGYNAPVHNFVDLIYSHYKYTGNAALWDVKRAQVHALLSGQTAILNHLCHSETDVRFWGWEANASGYNLMGSLLRYRSYKQAAELEELTSGPHAQDYADERDAIKAALETYLWDSGSGYFLRATGEGQTQRHTVGTAYAIVLGACSPSVASAGRASLIAGLQNSFESGFEARGHIRFYPIPDAIPGGDYASHWGCFTGWMALAVGEPYASQILGRFADYCREIGLEAAPAEIISDAGVGGIGQRYSASASNAAQLFYGVTDR